MQAIRPFNRTNVELKLRSQPQQVYINPPFNRTNVELKFEIFRSPVL